MRQKLLEFYHYLNNATATPTDSPEERIRKKAYTLMVFLKCIGCVGWVIMYILLGLTFSALFPALFGLITLMSIGLYFLTKNFAYFVSVPLFFMLVTPILLQWSLGGFTASGAVMLWSILAPVGALVFRDIREAKVWFAGFLLLIPVSVFLEGIVPQAEPRRVWVMGMFFTMNIGFVATIVFATIVYFIKQIRKERDTVEEKNSALETTLLQLQELQQQLILKEKMASLGNLVAGIAHEINTPIGVVSSGADVSQRCVAKIESVVAPQHHSSVENLLGLLKDNIGAMSLAGERITTLVQNLKNFAHLDEAEFQQVNLHEGLDSTVALIQSNLHSNIDIVREYGQIPLIYGSPSQINQVFMSLLQRAIEAFEDTGMITIRTSVADTQIHIEISDTGIGIAREKLNSIFDFGFSTEQSRVKMTMGLSTAYNIVQQHHGDILVTSKMGEGSQFTVMLPIEQSV